MERSKQHLSSEEARDHFGERLSEVTGDENARWMAAAWRVKDGRIELCAVSRFRFPTGDYLATVGHLALRLFEDQKEASGILPSDPLPKVNLFGGNDGFVPTIEELTLPRKMPPPRITLPEEEFGPFPITGNPEERIECEEDVEGPPDED